MYLLPPHVPRLFSTSASTAPFPFHSADVPRSRGDPIRTCINTYTQIDPKHPAHMRARTHAHTHKRTHTCTSLTSHGSPAESHADNRSTVRSRCTFTNTIHPAAAAIRHMYAHRPVERHHHCIVLYPRSLLVGLDEHGANQTSVNVRVFARNQPCV